MPKRVIYHPPPREVIDEYAHQVCEQRVYFNLILLANAGHRMK